MSMPELIIEAITDKRHALQTERSELMMKMRLLEIDLKAIDHKIKTLEANAKEMKEILAGVVYYSENQ